MLTRNSTGVQNDNAMSSIDVDLCPVKIDNSVDMVELYELISNQNILRLLVPLNADVG